MLLNGSKAIARKSLIAFFLIGAVYISLKVFLGPSQSIKPINPEQLFVIKKGSTFNEVLDNLYDQFQIQNPHWIKIYYRIKGVPNIQAGRYDISTEIKLNNLIERFIEGDVKKYKFTIIEGSIAKNALRKLENIITKNEFENKLTDGIKKVFSSEAQILPDTYIFSDIDELEDILITYQDYLKRYLDEVWTQKPEGNPLKNKTEALVLASIIEREAVLLSEKPQIASVFLFRLVKGMRLQADPTSSYGYYGDFSKKIGRAALDDNNIFNTYRINGLPPSPICFPSKSSIEAAIKSIPSDYLYFVARGDGSHVFSKNLEDHNKAVKKFISGK